MPNNLHSSLHIEDDPLWSNVVARVLRSVPELARTAHARNGTDGLALARTLQPDIVLLDLRLPDADGFLLSAGLARFVPAPKILLVTARGDDATLFHATQPHIAGLVWKSTEIAGELPEAMRAALLGKKYYPPDVRDALRRLRADPNAFFKILSEREISLLPHFSLGETDEQIAAAVGLSAFTVKSHRQHIMAKIGLHRTPDLIRWALDHGFVPSPHERGVARENPQAPYPAS